MAAPADFFVSYASADQLWAEWISWHLEEAGFTVVVKAWDFIPGSDWVVEMREAAKSKRTIAVLSPAYLASGPSIAEWAVAFSADPTGREGTLVPVRVVDFILDGLDRSRIHADLVAVDEAEALRRLLAAARRVRLKPTTAPVFPAHPATADPPFFPGEPIDTPASPHWWLRGRAIAVLGAVTVGIAGVAIAIVVGRVGDGTSPTTTSLSGTHSTLGPQSPPATTATTTSRPPDAPNGNRLLLKFDGGIKTDPTGRRYLEDASGYGNDGLVRNEGGGNVATVSRDGGLALQFPRRCIPDVSTRCPTANLEIASTDDLNPGARDFSFGADVLVTAAQADSHSDIVRKGYSKDTTGQWRLQFEEDGLVSCAVSSDETAPPTVRSPVSVDDGTWHRIRCTRSGATLTIQVDDSIPRPVAIPANLSVETPKDVLVGGAGENQFFGALDNVYLSIS